MIDHEHGCLVRAGRLSPEQIVPFDMLKETPDPSILEGFHAVIMGGTGDYSVARDRPPFFAPLVDLTLHLLERGLPTLGLCYGFHLMGHAVGGLVQTRPEMSETGTFEVILTEDGQRDTILAHLPPRFLAQQGHHDVVVEVPSGFTKLATSERCSWQALRHPEKPFYGLQFHPELRREDFMQRMRIYSQTYASTPEKLAEIDRQVKQTTLEDVIEKFVDQVVLPHTFGCGCGGGRAAGGPK